MREHRTIKQKVGEYAETREISPVDCHMKEKTPGVDFLDIRAALTIDAKFSPVLPIEGIDRNQKMYTDSNSTSQWVARWMRMRRSRMLSRREMQCLGLLAAGFSNRGIAEALAISEPTVAMHLKNARKRLGARTREHAVAIAISCGFIKPAVPVPADADDRVVPLPPLAAAS